MCYPLIMYVFTLCFYVNMNDVNKFLYFQMFEKSLGPERFLHEIAGASAFGHNRRQNGQLIFIM